MGIFGWSYPPGCSGPQDEPDPHPDSERIYEILENAEVNGDIIDEVLKIVDQLIEKAEAPCPRCQAEAIRQEMEAEKLAQEYWAEEERRLKNGEI